jgi:hypothetical protein
MKMPATISDNSDSTMPGRGNPTEPEKAPVTGWRGSDFMFRARYMPTTQTIYPKLRWTPSDPCVFRF